MTSSPLKLEGTPCKHPTYVIDADDRHIHCSTCGEVLSAFDVLCEVAREYGQQDGFLGKARGELAHLYQQIDEQQVALRRIRKSVNNEDKKLNRLIARRKALEGEVGKAEREHAEGTLQLKLEAFDAGSRYPTT